MFVSVNLTVEQIDEGDFVGTARRSILNYAFTDDIVLQEIK